VEIKGQLDATDWFLLQNLLFAQHVSGIIMPIIRSSRFIQMVSAYGTWRCTDGKWCLKHVEQTISSAVKTNLLHLLGLLFPHINDDARSNKHQV